MESFLGIVKNPKSSRSNQIMTRSKERRNKRRGSNGYDNNNNNLVTEWGQTKKKKQKKKKKNKKKKSLETKFGKSLTAIDISKKMVV